MLNREVNNSHVFLSSYFYEAPMMSFKPFAITFFLMSLSHRLLYHYPQYHTHTVPGRFAKIACVWATYLLIVQCCCKINTEHSGALDLNTYQEQV